MPFLMAIACRTRRRTVLRCECLNSPARATWDLRLACRQLRDSGVYRSRLRCGRFCSVLVCTMGQATTDAAVVFSSAKQQCVPSWRASRPGQPVRSVAAAYPSTAPDPGSFPPARYRHLLKRSRISPHAVKIRPAPGAPPHLRRRHGIGDCDSLAG